MKWTLLIIIFNAFLILLVAIAMERDRQSRSEASRGQSGLTDKWQTPPATPPAEAQEGQGKKENSDDTGGMSMWDIPDE